MKFNIETIIIFVRDVEKMKLFYVDVLKLEIIEEIKWEWVLLKAGNCKIGLHKIGEKYLSKKKENFGVNNNNKIVFEIDDDIKKVREHLISKKVVMREIKSFDDISILCDGEDPEGNVFQLKQKK